MTDPSKPDAWGMEFDLSVNTMRLHVHNDQIVVEGWASQGDGSYTRIVTQARVITIADGTLRFDAVAAQ